MLKHRTYPKQYNPCHLKVDFSIQLIVKFQILINFLWQMLDFCLGCSNKKCWIWFLALIFLLLTFLFFWGNTYEAIQPVKTTIFSCRKITFEQELAAFLPVFSTRAAQIQLSVWLKSLRVPKYVHLTLVYWNTRNSLCYNLAIPFKDGITFAVTTATQRLQRCNLESEADMTYVAVTKFLFWSKFSKF